MMTTEGCYRDCFAAPSGLRGTLVRTKTTGAGKKKEQLEVVVDAAAFISDPTWLRVGWELWAAVFPDRDFPLGLPVMGLQAMRCVEATYADSAAMSRALLQELPDEAGESSLSQMRL